MKRAVSVLLLLVAATLAPAAAQGNKLAGFTWKSQVSVSLDGEVKSQKVFQVTEDATGKQQKTEVSDLQAPSQGGGPLRQRLAHRMAERETAWIEGLQQHMAAYGQVPQDKMKAWVNTANVQPVQSPAGAVQIQGKALVDPADQVTLVVNQETKAPIQMSVQTVYDGQNVTMNVRYGLIDNQIPYPANTDLKVPGKDNLEIQVQNSDYVKNS